MSSISKRTFATPGSRSFATPSTASRSFHENGPSSQTRKKHAEVNTSGSFSKAPQSKINTTEIINQTPDNGSNFYKRSLLDSVAYAPTKRSVIYTSPDSEILSSSQKSSANFDKTLQPCNSEESSTAFKTPSDLQAANRDPSNRQNSTNLPFGVSGGAANVSLQITNSTSCKEPHAFRDTQMSANRRCSDSFLVQKQSSVRDASDLSQNENHQHFKQNTICSERGDGDAKVYMCAVKSIGKIGIAYYDTDNCQIKMMEDVVETADYHFLKLMKRRIQPDVIITNAKQEESFLQALREEDEEEGSVLEKHVRIEIIPCMMFGYELCKRRILTLNGLPDLSESASELERNVYFGSMLSFDSINMVRAAGALIKFLDKNRVGVELEDPGTKVPIVALKSFSLNSVMMVDDTTYGALQIFSKEAHPSVYKSGGSGSKEGLSLFGIINYTKSTAGSKLLRQWFLHPLTNIDEIKERQLAIASFLSNRNLEAVMAFQDSMKHMKNISGVLSKMMSTGASITDWQNLYKTIYNAICISDICRGMQQDVGIIKKIANSFTQELYTMANLINKIVDFEESITQCRFVVKPGIDAELDERKRTYNGLPDLMTKVASEELKRLDDSITECGVSYLPQLGYLLAVPVTETMKNEQKFDVDGLEFVFFSDEIVHYKTAGTRDHETAIMHRLQGVILENTQLLLSVVDLAAELDCLLSLATAARECNYARPKLTEDTDISIKNGRHPLQELCTTQFVPNDFIMDTQQKRIKIITGPNASGKSVYLKQVGLIVFLAHIGSFVPAQEATIGVSDRLFTRIHTKETVSTPLSTFMIDINQISAAIHGATERSVVLVDEFGKGTSADDGLALLASVISHWLGKGPKCPRTLVSTHFHGLISYNLLPESELIHYQTMDVIEENGELVFLFQIKDGHADCSYALHVAKVAGIDENILKRAAEVSRVITSGGEVERMHSVDSETRFDRFSAITEKFLELDIESCDVISFLQGCVSLVNED